MIPTRFAILVAAALAVVPAAHVFAHGDVTPQPIDTAGLEPLGEEWRKENPYRENPKAIEIGASGYNQNCARCHGLEVISGGLAPDLRYLEKGEQGDTWFLERIRHGAKKSDGTTIMPGFEGTFSQEAMWAIRAYVESVHVD
ncbi:MAG: cytochrome c-550 PedF [Hyphomicrobium sp.]|jgi:cytochrome c-550 PedF|nr:cytochrome c-550 PedF [Hyphomicrobium sp.]PPD06341.1 MAG: cytochrome c-550 PedF [Hyphomicrobium sp.]